MGVICKSFGIIEMRRILISIICVGGPQRCGERGRPGEKPKWSKLLILKTLGALHDKIAF